MANLESTLNQRANSACELCEATKDLSIYQVTSDEEASKIIPYWFVNIV
jgi:hypothetical protein